MTVIKRDRSASSKDLQTAIQEFIDLLSDQNEEDAIAALKQANQLLNGAKPGDAKHKQALEVLNDAFYDTHELCAYIIEKPKGDEWTLVDQLSQGASRVAALLKRLQ